MANENINNMNVQNEEITLEIEGDETVVASKVTDEELKFAETGYDVLSKEAVDNAVSYGLPFSGFGFSLVFIVLAIIMFIVTIFGKIFGVKQPKPVAEVKKAEKAESKPEPKEEAVASVAHVSNDNGIIAAIVAAVSAFRTATGTTGGFRVVSFKKRK